MRVSKMSIDMCRHFPNVAVLNLGGGYKVARMPGEKATSLQAIGVPVSQNLLAFEQETGRRLWLEIEPGTFLVANAGAIVATVNDVVNTGKSGRKFIKLDAGMSEMVSV
jgi:diaminopimelate decarboxylase